MALFILGSFATTPSREEQRQKIQKIRQQFRDELKPLKEQFHAKKDELNAKLRLPERGEAYQQVLRNLFNEVQEIKNKIMIKSFEMKLQIRELLSDEQLKKLGWRNKSRKAKNNALEDEEDF